MFFLHTAELRRRPRLGAADQALDFLQLRRVNLAGLLALEEPFDQVLQALAEPTRRAIVQRLCAGSASVSELAAPFSVSLSKVQMGYVFFFQAEDGIRYKLVTGVQTCALPICRTTSPRSRA